MHGLGIDDIHILRHDVGHALACLELGSFVSRQAIPLGLPLAHAVRAEYLGQSVGLRNVSADAFHVLNDRVGPAARPAVMISSCLSSLILCSVA